MNNWQRKIYEQIEGVVSKGVPMFDKENEAIKFTPTQAYLIKTTIDDLELETSVLKQKLDMAEDTISVLKIER